MDGSGRAGRKLTESADLGQHQGLQISLVKAQLLSVLCVQHLYAQAISGAYWISSNGCDYAIGAEEWVRLAPGLSLIEGEGALRLSPANTCLDMQVEKRVRWLRRALDHWSIKMHVKVTIGE